MDLFTPIINEDKQHKNFKSLLHDSRRYHREIITTWANDFPDRDNKLIDEFQRTFNSSFWEVYLHALFKEYEFALNWEHTRPDFYIKNKEFEFIVEATTANKGEDRIISEWETNLTPELMDEYLDNMNEYNRYSIIRLSNSIKTKLAKYRDSYRYLAHVKNKPFVLAIAPFEQPLHYLQYDRPMMALLYDLYVDEEEYRQNPELFLNGIPYTSLGSVEKDNGSDVILGLFNDDSLSEISAIIFNAIATVGKAANMSNGMQVTAHIWEKKDEGLIQTIGKKELIEDGLFIFHNPYAKYKIPLDVFSKNRVCQVFLDEQTGMISKNYGEKHLCSRMNHNINIM